ncbi:MAG TPA: cytochrome o ubiquinol oxidase subunit IV [Caulobacteraceae bacterium]|jgi:cytochrome o ubiquinol oxidase operon protein cyoD
MSHSDTDPNLHSEDRDHREDHAPGDEPEESAGHWILNANLGLGLSILLTVTAFVLAATHLVYAPSIPVALLVLAIAQMGVHLVFFLHVTTGPDNTNNVLALAFGILVVFLLVVGSIWIMAHLSHNMMPMPPDQMQSMQQ